MSVVYHAIRGGVGHEADFLDLVVHCLLEQLIEFGGFLGRYAGVGDFDGDGDGTGVTAEVRQAELLLVGHAEDDCHVV